MNALAPVDDKPRRAMIEVVDPIPVLDTSRFEHMQRIANVMAQSTLIPESLYKEGTGDNKRELPLPQIISNCFLVVNQAVRWGLDPFAVAQSVSVVRGKLCYEGKLVAAVLDAKLGVRLHAHFTGDPASKEYRIYLSDVPWTEDLIAKLKPGVSIPGTRIVTGSVNDWHAGDKSPWGAVKNYPRMLIYRGSRDWARFFEPAILLGVYTPDEMLDLVENARAIRAREASPSLAERLSAAKAQGSPQTPEGFALDYVTDQTADAASEAGSGHSEASGDMPGNDPGGEEGGASAAGDLFTESDVTGQDDPPPPALDTVSDEDRAWLVTVYKSLKAAVGPDVDVLKRQSLIFKDDAASKSALVRAKATKIRTELERCCGDDPQVGTVVVGRYLAGIIGVDERDLAD